MSTRTPGRLRVSRVGEAVIQPSFNEEAKKKVLVYIEAKDNSTTDSHHSYMSEQGVMVYQWAILDRISYMHVIFEMTDKEAFDKEVIIAQNFVRDNGGRW